MSKLENALKDLKVDEAWETFNDFKRLYGFPSHLLIDAGKRYTTPNERIAFAISSYGEDRGWNMSSVQSVDRAL
ncbi:hypothetical protein V6N13_085330 [Hibiscus sabdariffa]